MATQPSTQLDPVQQIGQTLVELCRENRNLEAVEKLYADNIVSVEAGGPPNEREMRGKQAIREKHHWWYSNHEIHSATAEGPYPNGNQFIVIFKMDLTNKPSGHRFQMTEAGLYTVENGKIAREEFFYNM